MEESAVRQPDDQPSRCLVQQAVGECLRIFNMSPGIVEVLNVANGVIHLRVSCLQQGASDKDRIHLRLREYLQLKFPRLRGTVIQFDPVSGD